MTKEQVLSTLISPKLSEGEELVGFFQATYTPSIGWGVLFGALTSFGLRVYFVAITDKGMHLHKLTFFGKPGKYQFLPWNEVKDLKLGSGILAAPLRFNYSQDKSLKLKVLIKGVEKAAKMDEKTKEFLLSKASL